MKKHLLLIVIVSMLFSTIWANPYDAPFDQMQQLTEFKAFDIPETFEKTFKGERDYLMRAAAFNFYDVTGQNKIDAIRLAQYDITLGVGNQKFGAKNNIKNIEALTMLVRMFSDDSALKQNVIDANRGAHQMALKNAFYDAYYQEAKTLNILDVGEEVSYVKLASKENIARWLVNAAKITSEFTQSDLYKAKDWQQIAPNNLKAVEILVDQRMLSLDENDKFNPKVAMTRSAFANLLGRVFNKYSDRLNTDIYYGQIVSKQTIDAVEGQTVHLVVRGVDNNFNKITLDKPNEGIKNGLVVYKNGQLVTDQKLAVGDEINYLVQDKVVKYTVVLQKGEVLKRLIQTLARLEGIKVSQGVVVSSKKERSTLDGGDKIKTRIRVERDNDAMVDLVSTHDKVSTFVIEYPVINGITYQTPSAIVKGDALTLYTKDNQILYAIRGKAPIKEIKGTLRMIDQTKSPAQIVLLNFNDEIITLPVDNDANISVNYYQAKLSDLKVGANTTVQTMQGKAIAITSDSYQPVSGYIPKQGKIAYGVVLKAHSTGITLKDGKAYSLDENTSVFSGANKVEAKSIKAGDKVKLYFDDIYTSVPSKVSIEGVEQLIKQLEKGKISNYNAFTNELTIVDRYTLKNTLWQNEIASYTQSYQLAKGVEIYDSTGKIITSEFNINYKDKIAYFIVADNFGRKEITKLIVKDGFEKQYNDVVDKYSNVLDKMELKNRVNVGYGPATIFIQNGRLVDEEVLRENASVYVLSNQKNGIDNAQIVNVLGDYKNYFDSFYVGALERVDPYGITIVNYSTTQDYRWASINKEEKSLSINDETQIYDSTKKTYINRQLLFNNPYNREENKNKDGRGLKTERYYGVYVTDGYDNVIAMRIRHKALVNNDNIDDRITLESAIPDKLDKILSATRFTKGTITDFNKKWQRIELTDSYNFLGYHKEWVANTTETYIELGDAVIIKNGQPISYDDLKVGDRVFLVREDEDALVMYVE